MIKYLSPILALFWKDILLELRTKEIIVAVLAFSLLVIFIFNFAIDPTPGTSSLIAPGVLWVAFLFAGVLGFTRSFVLEKDGGSFQGLMLMPVTRDIIFFGKMLSNFAFMLLVEVIVFPVFAVLFNLSFSMIGVISVLLLSTVGISCVGTLFSAIAINTKAREVMLPLLFFPVVVPVIIGAVELSRVVFRGGWYLESTPWVPLLIAFDAIFLVACPFAFHFLVEE